jgi:PTS system nitrogen regulatory IIA component
MTTQTIQGGLMTVDEVARYLRISIAKAYQMAARGELPTVRMGRTVRVRADRLEAWLDQRTSR